MLKRNSNCFGLFNAFGLINHNLSRAVSKHIFNLKNNEVYVRSIP